MPLDSTTWKVTETPAAEPDVFALESFIAWAEKHDPNEQFSYADFRCCPVACYYRDHGIAYVVHCYDLHLGLTPAQLLEYAAASTYPCTYGNLLVTARKLLAERNG